MARRGIVWSALFKDLYESSSLRTWGFITIATYVFLVKNGMGPVFSLLILAPSTYIAGLIFFLVFEEILIPFYNWLTKKKS
jgi:hypothetical protein